jgi:signal peptidase II
LAGFCFIIGGGIGNLFDRIFRGSVTDFLYIKFGIFHTGIFNLADVSIMSGMFIVLIQFFLKRKYYRFRELE